MLPLYCRKILLNFRYSIRHESFLVANVARLWSWKLSLSIPSTDPYIFPESNSLVWPVTLSCTLLVYGLGSHMNFIGAIFACASSKRELQVPPPSYSSLQITATLAYSAMSQTLLEEKEFAYPNPETPPSSKVSQRARARSSATSKKCWGQFIILF